MGDARTQRGRNDNNDKPTNEKKANLHLPFLKPNYANH